MMKKIYLILIIALNCHLKYDANAGLNIHNQSLDICQYSYENKTIYDMPKDLDNLFSTASSVIQTDSCQNRIEFIREAIISFIKKGTEQIFDESFLQAISIACKPPWECYFPNNKDDIAQLYLLGDSLLLEKAKFDERAMKLIIDIYLTYSNSPEIAEYFGFNIVPKAAVVNTITFIKVLSLKSENEIDKCIRKLRALEDPSAIESIKTQINQLNNNYRNITSKISNAILQ